MSSINIEKNQMEILNNFFVGCAEKDDLKGVVYSIKKGATAWREAVREAAVKGNKMMVKAIRDSIRKRLVETSKKTDNKKMVEKFDKAVCEQIYTGACKGGCLDLAIDNIPESETVKNEAAYFAGEWGRDNLFHIFVSVKEKQEFAKGAAFAGHTELVKKILKEDSKYELNFQTIFSSALASKKDIAFYLADSPRLDVEFAIESAKSHKRPDIAGFLSMKFERCIPKKPKLVRQTCVH